MLKKIFQKKFKFLLSFLLSFFISAVFCILFYLFDDTRITSFLNTMEANVEVINYFFSSLVKGTYRGNFNDKRKNMKNFIILAIDDETIQEYGGSWPFNRKVWADFLNHLNKSQNPPMVLFDIIFAEPSAYPESDKALIEAFKNYKGVLVEDLIFETFSLSVGKYIDDKEFILKILEGRGEGDNYFSPKIQALKRFEIDFEDRFHITKFAKVSSMMKELAEHIDIAGSANVDVSINPTTKVPLVVSSFFYYRENDELKLTNVYYPAIVLAMAAKIFDTEVTNYELKDNNFILKNALYDGKRMDFKIPVDDEIKMKINYKSFPNSGFIRTIPFAKYKEYNFSSNDILFIGMYSKIGAFDIHQSPFGQMYGIELLAYSLGTILNRDFIFDKRNLTTDFLYTLGVAFVSGVLVCFGTIFAIVAIFIAILLPIVIGIMTFISGYSIITLTPILSALIVVIVMQIYMLLTEEKDKKRIKGLFSSYVNPKLVDILIQNPDKLKLGGEERKVTIFFSAVKNLEEISEKLQAKDMVDFLNNYFSKMAEIVINLDGTLDKYIGDNVMAFWGAPIEIEDQEYKACEAAIKMLYTVEDMNKELKQKGIPPINLTIGINTGIVVVGNVGSEQQTNYTAIGDNVNLASRVKGLNKYFHTHIIITENTYEAVKDKFYIRELDLTKVKGKTKPVRIYELIDFKE
ncbi:MAG: adenylate/guanylate cyclase domain-containing protein [Brevinematales bacterium]|nr:adenylate/guanylate cyclase domain-containing protein [Brevinematales bacterium]